MRSISLKGAKKKAWDAFSLWVRISNTDSLGFIYCYCGKRVHYKESQASHLVPGRSNSILFDERGVYPSCCACNIFKSGNLIEYMKFLEQKLGVWEASELRNELLMLSKKPSKLTIQDYQFIEEKYKKKLSDLKLSNKIKKSLVFKIVKNTNE